MRERKHIDRLYQEKFRDFESLPREAVWRSISARLREQDEKKFPFVPILSRVAGIAAMLTILFLIGNWFFPVDIPPKVASEEIDLDDLTRDPTNSLALENLPQVKVPAPSPGKKNALGLVAESEKNETSPLVKPLESPIKKFGVKITENDFATAILNFFGRSEDPLEKENPLHAATSIEEKLVSEPAQFELSTFAAPVYFGNLGGNNYLGPGLAEHQKQAEVTYSYGIHIAYSLSEKIKIRSGVNKVSMHYSVSGVSYPALVGLVEIRSITREHAAMGRTGKAGIKKVQQPISEVSSSYAGAIGSGQLNQRTGYIEIPFELEYSLWNKKVGINLIGGASTLFLDQNSISIRSYQGVSALGIAKNLNEISFSTNIGLGLDYDLTEKFKFNLEPMFKYRLNTFSSSSSESQPYYFGIYSGFSFKF